MWTPGSLLRTEGTQCCSGMVSIDKSLPPQIFEPHIVNYYLQSSSATQGDFTCVLLSDKYRHTTVDLTVSEPTVADSGSLPIETTPCFGEHDHRISFPFSPQCSGSRVQGPREAGSAADQHSALACQMCHYHEVTHTHTRTHTHTHTHTHTQFQASHNIPPEVCI